MSHDDEILKLKEWYAEEIGKRDRIIDELREQNMLLVKSALRQSERTVQYQEMAKKPKK